MDNTHTSDSIVSFFAFLFVSLSGADRQSPTTKLTRRTGMASKAIVMRGNFIYAGISIVGAKRACDALIVCASSVAYSCRGRLQYTPTPSLHCKSCFSSMLLV